MADADSKLIEKIIELIEVKLERLKLTIISKVASVFSMAFALALFLIFSFFVFFFLNFAIANLINQSLKSAYLGFLIISGFYALIILILLIFFKKKMTLRLFESLILKSLNPNEKESED